MTFVTHDTVTPDRERETLICGDKSRTQQSFKEECDINRILAKFRKTGELSHLTDHEPQYGDFSSSVDYKEALDRVHAAQADFDGLSARVRARMQNNPANLLAFMDDPENEDEARELGLLPQLEHPEPPPPSGPDPQGATASEAPASPSPAS